MTEEKADLERFVIGLYPVSADGEGGRVPGLCGSNNHGLTKQLSVRSQDSWEHVGFWADGETGQEKKPSRVQTWEMLTLST